MALDPRARRSGMPAEQFVSALREQLGALADNLHILEMRAEAGDVGPEVVEACRLVIDAQLEQLFAAMSRPWTGEGS